ELAQQEVGDVGATDRRQAAPTGKRLRLVLREFEPAPVSVSPVFARARLLACAMRGAVCGNGYIRLRRRRSPGAPASMHPIRPVERVGNAPVLVRRANGDRPHNLTPRRGELKGFGGRRLLGAFNALTVAAPCP